jgi:transcriptional regulator with XRE-family HTH domain
MATANGSDAELGALSNLGVVLRAERERRGYTLADVAEQTGLSRSFLSLVEGGKSDISLGRLHRILTFYDISFPHLFDNSSRKNSVVRAGERGRMRFDAELCDVSMLMAPGTVRAMFPMLIELEPGGGQRSPVQDKGEQFIHVVEGQLEVTLSAEEAEPHILQPGDSVYLDCERGYRVRNSAARPARYLCVVTT